MVDLYNASRASAGCFDEAAVTLAEFLGGIEGEDVHVATLAGAVVGFVSVWVPERFIHHLYVSPAHQGCGVGSALLRACEARYGRPMSLKCVTRNLRARRFYQQRGWRCEGGGVGEDGPWEHWYSPPGP
ncbi:GNAT family N-acetyltransferase [Denitromonas iodatirespirans]|uniref:GNAT family N-acetyltransferase n=1 Tax=Denitromonas iodatirespirans TaxID=2795389 RepID=A0A944DCH1_DENI1|nr:GNAT family N-acetyltransferase [Denitromonas iodatirespirans]MBT0963959.1 GNAT family N-acetyltransferase [Denitromonas iodatirespirans]